MEIPGLAPFTLLRPEWLLGLALLPVASWAWNRFSGKSDWARYIDPAKLPYLRMGKSRNARLESNLTFLFLAIALVALAGPSFRSLPVPVQQTRDALVVAFDLSPSMLASDLEPDRLTRARLKIIDFLRRRKEGETALIAYAGDAYRVSPLTDDARTIEALMPSLHPSVMPATGSQVEAAFEMTRDLLVGASLDRGGILLVTDGIDEEAFSEMDGFLDSHIQLCVLAVGGNESVPIPLPGGGFLRDGRNKTVLAKVNFDEIANFSARHGGCFARLAPDDSDLERIEAFFAKASGNALDETEATFVQKQDEGHWLVLLLLPLAALAFRKNVFWIALLATTSFVTAPHDAVAFEWADLWERSDQQRYHTLREGLESYRGKDYEGAAELFAGPSTQEAYNRANALALAGQLEEALESYEQALATDPQHSDAKYNRDLVRELLEQSKQEDQNQENDDTSDSGEEGEPSEETNPSDSSQPNSETDGEDQSASSPEENSSGEPEQDAANQDEAPPEKSSDSQEGSGRDDDEPANETEASDAGSPEEQQKEQEHSVAEAPHEAEEPTPLSEQSEQWLRKIPDDPGGLMRRKFQYQAEERRQREARSGRRRSPERY